MMISLIITAKYNELNANAHGDPNHQKAQKSGKISCIKDGKITWL